MQRKEALLRQIPNVDRLLANPAADGCGTYRHELADAVRDVLSRLRERLITGETDIIPEDGEIVQIAMDLARRSARRGVRRVINGTGVILHSNLGRACMSEAAVQAAMETAAAYTTLEYDAEKGVRGKRTAFIEEKLCAVTGCEAAVIVNNNAAALLLILSSVASGGNVIVSRGELIEIGGAFRVPEIITQSGCRLREVGTTNRTRLSDYSGAIDGETRALLKIHSGNFKIVGFTQSVSVKELAELGAAFKLPVIDDVGSGALIDMRRYGIYDEPFAPESLKNGADVVSLSGDKLLGGPQSGIILGRNEYVDAMKRHPLYRALRLDKMTIAALEATLRVYSDPLAAERELPVLKMLALSEDVLYTRAAELCKHILKRGGNAEVVSAKSTAGGGAVPGLELDSFAIMPSGPLNADETDRALRALPLPIIGHIEKDRLILDVRTMFEEDFTYIAESIASLTTVQ